MAILNIFKKKKIKREEERIKPEVKPKKEAKKVKPVEKPKEKFKEEVVISKKERKILGKAYQILRTPHVTEKSTDLVSNRQYIFKVWSKANKKEIEKAGEELYGVDVIDVKIITVPSKKRRLGRIRGFRKGYKKAIVKIKEGQKIEVMPK